MMKKLWWAVGVALLIAPLSSGSRADDSKDAKAILEKAITALGGKEKLSKATNLTWKAKGKLNFMGNEAEFSTESWLQGMDHLRGEFSGDFGGNQIKAVTVMAGNKGWTQFGGMTMDMDDARLANEKRVVYLQLATTTIVPMLDKGFKIEAAPEEKVDGKPAAGVKVTGPDGKDFTVYFDRESGLPVKQVAKILDFMGNEFTQETTYGDYKEMAGIKKATKVDNKRDGEKFMSTQITEFKILDKIDPKMFAMPE